MDDFLSMKSRLLKETTITIYRDDGDVETVKTDRQSIDIKMIMKMLNSKTFRVLDLNKNNDFVMVIERDLNENLKTNIKATEFYNRNSDEEIDDIIGTAILFERNLFFERYKNNSK